MPDKMEKEKIAFVCQRYGLEVNGGAEAYCREVAEHLKELYDVTVYTTCAQDYVTWKNVYDPGESDIHGVHVKRYPTDRERNQQEFNLIHRLVMLNPKHSNRQENNWVYKQGPVCTELIEALRAEHLQYKAVLFVTYLYYTTVKGMELNLKNAILVPTVHDEPPVYLRVFDTVFYNAKAIAWNTPEERIFALKRFPGIDRTTSVMTGIGVDKPQMELPEIPEALHSSDYLVYAGRIDESKGCGEMFRFFQKYKKRHSGDLKLALLGKPVMDIPEDPDIVCLGFVSEEMKFAVMKNAVALLLFSHFESLSIVVLESMIMGRPVLVTEKCEVLKGHCIRSNAGLYFNSYEEFDAALNWLRTHPAEYAVMRENGKKYVEQNYRWDVIIEKYQELIQSLADRQ